MAQKIPQLKVSPEIHKRLQIERLRRDMFLGELVDKALREWLDGLGPSRSAMETELEAILERGDPASVDSLKYFIHLVYEQLPARDVEADAEPGVQPLPQSKVEEVWRKKRHRKSG